MSTVDPITNTDYNYQHLFESLEDLAVILLDKDGYIQSWNKGAEKIYGYKANDVAGENFEILYTESDQESRIPQRLIVEAVGKAKAIYEGWCVKKDGTRFFAKMNISACYDVEEHLTGFSVIVNDITEQNYVEKQTEFEKSNLEALINSDCKNMLWSVSRDYLLVSSNHEFDKVMISMLGRGIEKGITVLQDGFDKEQLVRFKEYYDRALTGEVFTIKEHVSVPVNYWAEMSFSPVRLNDDIVGAACCARDITEQVHANEKLEQEQYKYHSLIAQSTEAAAVISAEGKPLYVSPSIKNVLGYTDEELMLIDPVTLMHPEDIASKVLVLQAAIANPGIPVNGGEGRMQHKNGSWRWLECTVTNMLHDPSINGIVDNFRDITERKLAEEKINAINRLYSFSSHVNQAIVHVSDQRALFNKICRIIAIDEGKFKVAIIGVVNEKQRTINIVEQCGLAREDIPLFMDVSLDNEGLQAQVLHSGIYRVCNDLQSDVAMESWHAFTRSRGWGSGIVLPIKKGGVAFATLNVFSERLDFFTDQEIELLNEVANDISFALDVFEKEKQRQVAENKLRHSELRLKQAQSIAHFGSWERDLSTGILNWSDETLRIYGLGPHERLQTYQSWMSFIHPDDVESVRKIIKEGVANEDNVSFYHRIVRRDGAIRHIYSQTRLEFSPEGAPIGLYGIAHDITEIKEAEQKLVIANRLYAFISGINQAIVHVNDKHSLFNEACRIAVQVGGFAFAYIGEIDSERRKINLIAENNASQDDVKFFSGLEFAPDGPVTNVLESGSYCVINDYQKKPEGSRPRMYADSRGFKSMIALPIYNEGNISFVMSLFSSKKDFFNTEEMALLEIAVKDISYALEVFRKEQQREKAQRALQHSELRLKQAQEIAHIGSWELDFATGGAGWSEEALRIYGLSPLDTMQSCEAWRSFIHPDDLDHVTQHIEEARACLGNTAVFFRIIRKDGTIRHIYSLSKYEFDDTGRPIGLYGVDLDVTMLREAKQAIKQSEANLHMIVDLIPQSIFVKDYNGKFVFVNKSIAALYGVTPGQLIERSIEDTIPAENISEYFVSQDREVINTGIQVTIPEMKFKDKSGKDRVFHTTKVAYTLPGSNEKAVLGIANDITEQKQIEAERVKMVEDIVQRNNNLEQFSYIVSHNLRAPVANILGLADILNTAGNDEEEKKTMLNDISVSVQKLDDVIKDLNHVLQVKHQVNEEKEIIKCSDLVRDIKLSIANLFRNEEVEIITDFSGGNEILTLKSYLYSVFFNLISNSIKYRQTGIKPVIEITARNDGEKMEIIFKDNGMGIDLARRRDQVFGLYKRFHFHTEGKGMGLYMVKTQVETLGGTISIESEVNKGTVFKILLNNS